MTAQQNAAPPSCRACGHVALNTIADELEATALNKGFFGNALYTAMNIPGITYNDRILLSKWLRGAQRVADNIALQNLSVKIRKMEKSK